MTAPQPLQRRLSMASSGRTLCTLAASVNAASLAVSVLATRKPLLLFRLVGLFLLRFAERRFCGLLFQEPPRRTRDEGAGQGCGWKCAEHFSISGQRVSEAASKCGYERAEA